AADTRAFDVTIGPPLPILSLLLSPVEVVPAAGKPIWLLASPRSHQFPGFAETLIDLFLTEPGVHKEIGFGVEAPDEKVSAGRAYFCDPRDIGVAAAIGDRVKAAEVEHEGVIVSDTEVGQARDVALDEARCDVRGLHLLAGRLDRRRDEVDAGDVPA